MFETLRAKIVSGILLVLLIAVGVLGFLWQSQKVVTLRAQNELIRVEKEHTVALVEATNEITRLSVANGEIARRAEENINLANQKHKEEINAIHTRYTNDLAVVNRLRDTVKTLNSNVSSLADSTKTQYAITAGNNLAECSGTTVEMEQLARRYSAEIDFLLEAWPKQPEE